MSNIQMIPDLNTSYTESLFILQENFLSQRSRIDEWFQTQWLLTVPPVYGSIDLRNAGFKLAPIDMNLFPAGFNNLNPNFIDLSVKAAQDVLQKVMPGASKILIIPESHTRNLLYWTNIKTLQKILEKAGFIVFFGLIEGVDSSLTIDLPNQEKLEVYKLIRKQDKISVNHFDPDFILLNNDLSKGIPEILQNLKQPIIPPAELGWNQRLKSLYFQYYAEVANEFSKIVGIDDWLIAPLFRHCGQIDFMQQEGIDCLINNANQLFVQIQKKYQEYRIPYDPFLIVKADAGTYGMAVMTVRHVDELKSLNRKQRTKMATTKGGQPVNRVIIQEGVYTFETIGEEKAVAEPVVYLWGSKVVGGFYRIHEDRDIDENLNSPGMRFQPIAFSQTCDGHPENKETDIYKCRLYVYGIIAQLSMLAAAREIKDQQKSSILSH